MSKKIAITFPGQGSQSVGMLADLAAAYPLVRETFAEGSDALGVDLWALSQDGPKEQLNETQNTQPALLCAGMAVMRVLEQQLPEQPVVMAGHSLGEYTALVAAGVLGLADATRLVAMRGRFMQEAVPAGTGAMAAILGLDDEQVREVCAEGAQGQVAEAVNFNSPGPGGGRRQCRGHRTRCRSRQGRGCASRTDPGRERAFALCADETGGRAAGRSYAEPDFQCPNGCRCCTTSMSSEATDPAAIQTVVGRTTVLPGALGGDRPGHWRARC